MDGFGQDLVGFYEIWQYCAGFGMILQDLVEFGRAHSEARIWQDFAGFRRIWSYLAGFARILQDLAGFRKEDFSGFRRFGQDLAGFKYI